jgi:hypothetical protein
MLGSFNEPSGDYESNCYLADVRNFDDLDNLLFNDDGCTAHSSSYLCQSLGVYVCRVGTAPCEGGCPGGSYSPNGADCVICAAGTFLTLTLTTNHNHYPLTLTPNLYPNP